VKEEGLLPFDLFVEALAERFKDRMCEEVALLDDK
jgi:hypothetical protein